MEVCMPVCVYVHVQISVCGTYCVALAVLCVWF